MMSKTNKSNVQNTDVYKDPLLDFCKISETELDYEYAESLLESSNGKSETSSVPPSSRDIPRHQQTTKETGSKFHLQEQKGSDIMIKYQPNKNDNKSTAPDVLDLQRMVEKFAEEKVNTLKNVQKIVYETSGFDYELVTSVDKLLEESYIICSRFKDKLDHGTRAKLRNLITQLKKLPHMYEYMHQHTRKSARVLDWLSNNTDQPEPEMSGFTMRDPVQLRKFVSDTIPRISTSDTNITLGKRKRGLGECENDDVTNVHKSSSDSRIYVHADWSRPSGPRKRRRVRK